MSFKRHYAFLPYYLIFALLLGSCNKNNSGSNALDESTETTLPENPVNPSSDASPNILFVIADDLGIDAMPGYDLGEEKPLLPTLNRLTNEGIRFTQAWTYPVCTPTRASILTGKYGYRTGVLGVEQNNNLNPNERIIQRAFEGQYSTSIIGKWHVSNENVYLRPEEMGVGYYAGLFSGGVNNYSNWQLTTNGSTVRQNNYITTTLTDLAIDWIQAQDQPWFCWLAYNAPHTPFHLPPQELHSQGSLPEDEESISQNPLPYYFAMIESLDTELGRLISTLSSETLENTLIVFIGDNGTPNQVAQSPYTSSKAKGSLYEGGIHVPLVVSGYGVSRRGEEENALVTAVDLYNTFLDAAGLALEEDLDSQSFWPLIREGVSNDRRFNYSEIIGDRPNKSGYTLSDGRYKFLSLDNGNELLFDLQNDLSETTNLLEGQLTTSEETRLAALREEALRIRQ